MPTLAQAVGRPAGSILLHGISKSFRSGSGEIAALSNIDIAIPAGGIFGIIGRSGAGKSTLLRMINRLERPTSGEVLIDGQDIGRLDEHALVGLRRGIGMVFQHFNLLSAKTVWANVALPLVVTGMARAEIDRRVGEALDLVGLKDKNSTYPSRLSGGQKQRVGIARALVSGPRILLCDEATSALDPETTLSILQLLKDINRRLGITIVLITHEMGLIREICDRVLVLERGESVETGPVWQVFGSPAHAATRALLRPLLRDLPEDLAGKLLPEPPRGRRGEIVLALRFDGSRDPDLTGIISRYGGSLRLLDGTLDRIAGHTQGRLLLAAQIPEGRPVADTATRAQQVEVLGYVAADD